MLSIEKGFANETVALLWTLCVCLWHYMVSSAGALPSDSIAYWCRGFRTLRVSNHCIGVRFYTQIRAGASAGWERRVDVWDSGATRSPASKEPGKWIITHIITCYREIKIEGILCSQLKGGFTGLYFPLYLQHSLRYLQKLDLKVLTQIMQH